LRPAWRVVDDISHHHAMTVDGERIDDRARKGQIGPTTSGKLS
jgi:hypothetical protein